jgi:hypothetical protein
VNLPESRLIYDPATRRLDLANGSHGGSRDEARAASYVPTLLMLMQQREDEGEHEWSGTTLEKLLHESGRGPGQRACRDVRGVAVKKLYVDVRQQGRTEFHTLSPAGRKVALTWGNG